MGASIILLKTERNSKSKIDVRLYECDERFPMQSQDTATDDFCIPCNSDKTNCTSVSYNDDNCVIARKLQSSTNLRKIFTLGRETYSRLIVHDPVNNTIANLGIVNKHFNGYLTKISCEDHRYSLLVNGAFNPSDSFFFCLSHTAIEKLQFAPVSSYISRMKTFKSLCRNDALFRAAFKVTIENNLRSPLSVERQPDTKPQRYWVIAGYGDVPECLKAPRESYTEMASVDELSEYSGAVVWFEWEGEPNAIGEFTFQDWYMANSTSKMIPVGRYGVCLTNEVAKLRTEMVTNSDYVCLKSISWIGVVDVRTDGSTTVDNINTLPCHWPTKFSTIRDWAIHDCSKRNGETSKFINVFSGSLIVNLRSFWDDFFLDDDYIALKCKPYIYFPNVLNGKWYRRLEKRSGAVLWACTYVHESTDVSEMEILKVESESSKCCKNDLDSHTYLSMRRRIDDKSMDIDSTEILDVQSEISNYIHDLPQRYPEDYQSVLKLFFLVMTLPDEMRQNNLTIISYKHDSIINSLPRDVLRIILSMVVFVPHPNFCAKTKLSNGWYGHLHDLSCDIKKKISVSDYKTWCTGRPLTNSAANENNKMPILFHSKDTPKDCTIWDEYLMAVEEGNNPLYTPTAAFIYPYEDDICRPHAAYKVNSQNFITSVHLYVGSYNDSSDENQCDCDECLDTD